MNQNKFQDITIMSLLILSTLFITTWISNAEKGLVAGTTVGVFYTLIKTKSEINKKSISEWRFWLIISILAIIHIVALVAIKFPGLQAGLISLPFALVDGFAMWWLINWIERRFPASRDTGAEK